MHDNDEMTGAFSDKYQVTYISRVTYPKHAAHAIQMIHMAAAFARRTGDAHFFVYGLKRSCSREQILREYGVGENPLRIWSLHANRLPWRIRNYCIRTNTYNSLIAGILGIHPTWWLGNHRCQILFVRSPEDLLYWGAIRRRLWWLRNWIFVYEAHDAAGLEPRSSLGANPFDAREDAVGSRRQRLLQALCSYDVVQCVSQALANDLRQWSDGELDPFVVRHASALPRLSHPPELEPLDGQVTLGYFGSIDTYRGVDTLLMAMRFLPKSYRLRLVGNVRRHSGGSQGPKWLAEQDPAWLDDLMQDPAISRKVELVPWVPTHQVADEIDRCDVVLQPASSHILTLRYASPLKSFDYMVRGKPIVAADVLCHRELFEDGVNACLYRHDDGEHLAATIRSLIEQPRLAESIARKAWEQSAEYTYDGRAQRVLEIVGQVWEQRSSPVHAGTHKV